MTRLWFTTIACVIGLGFIVRPKLLKPALRTFSMRKGRSPKKNGSDFEPIVKNQDRLYKGRRHLVPSTSIPDPVCESGFALSAWLRNGKPRSKDFRR